MSAINNTFWLILIIKLEFCLPQCTTQGSFFNGACYWTIGSDVTWVGAETRCRRDNGTLAIIRSKEVQDTMISQLGSALQSGKSYWIGLTDLEEEGFLVWTNGRPLVWSELTAGSNSDALDCGSIDKTGAWAIADCAQTKPAICQLPRSPCGTNMLANESLCFWRTIKDVHDIDWQGALQACDRDGGSLVIIPDPQYETFLSEQFKFHKFTDQKRMWIALKRNADAKFTWWRYPASQIQLLEDGNYNKKPVEQTNGQEDCVMMYEDLQWHDWPCGGTIAANYICQKPTADMCQTVYHGNQGACYWTQDSPSSWDEAIAGCKKHGGVLAVLHNTDDTNFIKTHLQLNDSSEYHIGLRMISATEGVWMSGTYYTDSPLGDPTECAYIKFSAAAQIIFDQCSIPRKSLCMKATAPCTASNTDGNCYWRVTSYSHNATWPEAKAYCEVVGGTLAVVNTPQVLQFLQTKNIIRNDRPPVWIGLSDNSVESVFRWAGVAPLTWEKWITPGSGNKEPNGAKTQNCVVLTVNGFMDVKCDETHEFVCQRPGTVACPSPADVCSISSVPMNKTCQRFYSTPSNWDSASQTCNGWGNGTLVKIPDSTKNTKVQALISATSWTGANSKAVLSAFRWSWDNHVLTWENWVSGQPDNPELRCVAIQQDGQWMPTSCAAIMPFVCEAKPENLCTFAPSEVTVGSTKYTREKILTKTAKYRCPPGYIVPSLINTAEPSVQEVGCACPQEWTQANFLACVYVDCGVPTPVQYTTPVYSKTYYASTLTYQCQKGYHNPGQSVRATQTNVTCKANADWSAIPPPCQIIDCGTPNDVDHSTKTFSGTVYDNEVTYTCDTGYFVDVVNLIPSKSMKCKEDGKWDSNINCTVIDCGPPPNVTYANLVYENGTYYGSGSFYECHHFYLFPDLGRINSVWCNASGQWTDLGPCASLWPERRAKGCRKFDADVTFRVTFHNDGRFDYANVNCREGYKMVADGTRTRTVYCLKTGQWEKPQVLCEKEGCTETLSIPPPTLEDITPTGEPVLVDKYSDEITKTCPKGEKMQNGRKSMTTRCMGGDGWLPYIPSCKGQRCPPPPYVKDSVIVPLLGNNITTDSGRDFELKCREGYLFPDGTRSAPLSCSNQLRWDLKQDGNCGKDRCPKLQIPANSTIDNEIALFGTVVNVACDYGFKFPDNDVTKQVRCTASQTWMPTLVDCIEIICPAHPVVPNSRKTGDGQKYEDVIRYDCVGNRRTEEGTRFKEIKCELQSEWSENKFTCEAGRCEIPPTISNAQWRRIVNDGRSPIIYECNPGYLFFPQNLTEITATCNNITAKWRLSHNKCEPLYCPAVPEVNNSTRNSNKHRFMDVIKYTCDFGYTTQGGSFTTTCTQYGNWSDTLQECELVECGNFPVLSNSSATEINGTFFYQDKLNVSCDPGYWFRRNEYHRVLYCDGDASFKPLYSVCKEITCEALPIWTGVVGNSSQTGVGTVVNVSCAANMTLTSYVAFEICNCDGEGNWFCFRKEQWSMGLSMCIEIPRPKAEKVTTEAKSAKAVGTVAIVILFLFIGLIILVDIAANCFMAFYKFKQWRANQNPKMRLKTFDETPSASPTDQVGTSVGKDNVALPVLKPGDMPPPPIVFKKENTISNFKKAQLTFNQKVSPENTISPLEDVTELDVG